MGKDSSALDWGEGFQKFTRGGGRDFEEIISKIGEEAASVLE